LTDYDINRLWEAHNDLHEDFERLRARVIELERLHKGVAMTNLDKIEVKDANENG